MWNETFYIHKHVKFWYWKGGGISNRGKEKTEACMVKGEDGVVWPKGWEVSCKSCISLRVNFDNKEVGGYCYALLCRR